MIRLERVSKSFGAGAAEVRALEDVSLEIGEREFLTVVGASGCGKSTLIRLVAGLVLPSAGRVAIRGEAVTRPRSEIGIVFQSPTLLPWCDVVDNVLFPLRMTGRLGADSRARAEGLVALAGLAGFEKRYPRELSGGMQQRAAICRALIGDPEILLMDEPFGALDALTREEMSLELLRIWTERPKTIVFITHSIPEAVLLGDRVVVMSPRPGRIAEIIDVPLPRPRSFEQEATREFQHCTQRIRNLIFGSRRGARPAAAA